MICGDFNQAKTSRIGDGQLTNVVKIPTRGRNCLDLITLEMSRFYQNARTIPPIGKSDHLSVL